MMDNSYLKEENDFLRKELLEERYKTRQLQKKLDRIMDFISNYTDGNGSGSFE